MHAFLSRPNHHLPIPVPVFGAWIRHRRLELGLSFARAAAAAGLDQSDWKALEQGWVPSTDERLLRSIACALEIRFDELAHAIAPLLMHFAAITD